MSSHNLIIFILICLLIVSLLNYLWLLHSISVNGVNTSIKTNYLSNINVNKWSNTSFKTFTYVFPNNWITDKCYSDDCTLNSNIVDEKIKAFHNYLLQMSDKKIVIIPNEFNISPLHVSIDDQNNISYINKLTNN